MEEKGKGWHSASKVETRKGSDAMKKEGRKQNTGDWEEQGGGVRGCGYNSRLTYKKMEKRERQG